LNLPRPDTPWTVIRDGTVDAASRPSPNPCGVRLGDGSTLSRRQADWPTCFRLFSHASRHSFQLSFKLLCAIGSRTCLGLGDVFSRIRSEILIRPTRFYETSVLSPTGPSPSSAYCSKHLRLRTWRRFVATLPRPFGGASARPVLLSLAVTGSIAFAFFSCAYYDASVQRVPFRSPFEASVPSVAACAVREGMGAPRFLRMIGVYPTTKSHSDIPGSQNACVFPGHFAACRVLRRRRDQVIPMSAYAHRTVCMSE